jgi:ankyrin repeat protein
MRSICLFAILLLALLSGCKKPPPPVPLNQQLFTAVQNNDQALVAALLAKGADPKQPHITGEHYPLTVAAEKGNLAIAKQLLAKGADANYAGVVSPAGGHLFKQGIPLNAATKSLNLTMVHLLIEHGADVNAEFDNAGGLNTPLQAAIGAATPSPDHPVSAEQHAAAVAIIKLLVEKGAKPPQPTYGEILPPLHWAADTGDFELAKWLTEHGYDVKSTKYNKHSVLDYAASGGNVEFIRWLLAAGVDVQSPNENGWSPLYFAVIKGRSEAVQVLLEEAGCNVNGGSEPEKIYGGTPLHWAVRQNQLAIVKQLVDAGANVNLRNKDQLTPLGAGLAELKNPGLQQQLGRQEIVDFLKQQGATE